MPGIVQTDTGGNLMNHIAGGGNDAYLFAPAGENAPAVEDARVLLYGADLQWGCQLALENPGMRGRLTPAAARTTAGKAVAARPAVKSIRRCIVFGMLQSCRYTKIGRIGGCSGLFNSLG